MTFLIFIAIPALPLMFLALCGVRGMVKWTALYLITVLLLIVGFGVGLSWKWLVEPQSYWKSYTVPEMWMSTYINSLDVDAPLIDSLYALPLGFIDGIRLYIDFNLQKGGLALWIPEIVSFITIRNFWVMLTAK